MEPESKTNKLSIPVAIIVAGALIAGALYFGNKPSSIIGVKTGSQPSVAQSPSGPTTDQLNALKPITPNDHILGNPNALVKIVEFSDPECPFCKLFHSTMHKVIDEYGKNGKVAWIYRHFPLDQLHPKSRKETEATECANEQGGNDKFWAYIDRVFAVTPSNNGLDPAQLPQIARDVGLDVAKFNSCLSSGKYAQRIQDNVDEAIATGGNGTPWSIVVAPNGKKYPLSGAQPYENVKQIIDAALQQK